MSKKNKEKKCIICGFKKRVHSHHIIKRKDFGSDDEDNLVYLCPNHHWIADFGTEKDKQIILNMIIDITGKEGNKIDSKEIDFYDLKIKALSSQMFGDSVYDDEWWKTHRNTQNYQIIKNHLLGLNNHSFIRVASNKKAEILILINKLKKEIGMEIKGVIEDENGYRGFI